MQLTRVMIITSFCLLLFLGYGCSSIEYSSSPAENIIIDGNQDDWAGSLTYFEDPGLMIGVKNDSDNLYICLSTGISSISRRIAMGGLIVWFDPEGGSNEYKGIKFPIGIAGKKPDQQIMREMRDRMTNPETEKIPEMKMLAGRIEIIRTDPEENFVVDLKEASGIEAMISNENELTVIELKIPMKRSKENMFAIGTDPGNIIGIGFETPEIERPSKRMGGHGGGMPGGAMNGGEMGSGRGEMGGARGGMGSGMRSGGMNQQEKIDIWLKVSLSK